VRALQYTTIALASAGLTACCPDARVTSLADDAGVPTICIIGGITFADEAANPANGCQICQVAINPRGWTDRARGVPCPDGFCLKGSCLQGCLIDGGLVPTGGTSNSGCVACLPSMSTTSLTSEPDGTLCEAPGLGEVCYAGKCVTGCVVAGVLFPIDSLNPTNPCEACAAAASSQWSDVPAGTPCGGFNTCDGKGECKPPKSCAIGGTDYPHGAVSPMDPSLCCSPGLNPMGWSERLQDGGVYWANRFATGIAIADFNHDGRADLAISLGRRLRTSTLARERGHHAG
jgi:hypothetical protein